jgi:hypothetical protein
MSRSTLTTIIAVVVSVVVTVVVIAGFSASDVSPAAVRVNGDRVSQGELNSELSGFADSSFFSQSYAQAQPPVGFKVSNGAISSLAGAQWLGYRIETLLAKQALAREGESVNQKELDAARKALNEQSVLGGMSDSASDEIVRLQATLSKLVDVTGSADAARAAVRKAARNAHVTIDERYGEWSEKKLGVCPRTGCTRAVSVLPPAQQQ